MTFTNRLQALKALRDTTGSDRARMTSGSGLRRSHWPLTLGLLVDARVFDASSRSPVKIVAVERCQLRLPTAESLEVGTRLEQHADIVK